MSRPAPARIAVPCAPEGLSALTSGSGLRCPDGSVWVWGFLRLDWQVGGRPLVRTRPATSARPIRLEDPRVLGSRAPLPVRLQLGIFDRAQGVLIIR